MADKTIDGVAAQMRQILSADAAAPVTERRKFIPEFRAELQTNADALSALNQAVPLSESERRGASDVYKTSLDEAREWVRSIHGRIRGLAPNIDKLPVFTAYGFERDVVGALDDDRVIFLLEQAPIGSANQTIEAAKLPEDWLETLGELLETIEENAPKANIAGRSSVVGQRREVLKRAADLISRVAGYLTYALPERDYDPLMHQYGFTPRKKPVRAKQTPSATPVS